jgi:hypothetical protein
MAEHMEAIFNRCASGEIDPENIKKKTLDA